jgi:hypothetical protein
VAPRFPAAAVLGPQIPAPLLPFTGPRLVVDSQARGASIELHDQEYVVHLPSAMAKALFDQFPGSAPMLRTVYSEGIRRNAQVNDSAALPLSVATGDFDKDSVADIAMIVTTRDTARIVVLLSNAHEGAPRLLLSGHPWSAKSTDEQDLYLGPQPAGRLPNDFMLRSDGFRVEIADKVSTVRFLENGELRSMTVSAD